MDVKTKHLLEGVIQQLESFGDERLQAYLETNFTHKQLIGLFSKLLHSYRLAAHAANSGWKLWDLLRHPVPSSEDYKVDEAINGLEGALSHYAPAQFTGRTGEASSDGTYVQMLEELYNQIEHEVSVAGVQELVYEEIVKTQKRMG